MSTFATDSTHLDDAALMRLVDGEDAASTRARWDTHIASCAQCAAEAEQLRADAAAVRTWLERAAFEEGGDVARQRTVAPHDLAAPWLRAAAVIALLAAPVAAVTTIPSLRAWFSEAIVQLRGGESAVATGATQADAADVGRIHFLPDPGSFAVTLDNVQLTGTLRVAYGTDPSGEFDPGVATGVSPVFSPSSLRIRNHAQSSGSYVLVLPVTVTSVTVRIGPLTVAVLDARALRSGARLPLTAR